MTYPASGNAPNFAVEYQTNSLTWVDVASSTLRFNLEAEVFDPFHPVHGLEALIEVANFSGTFTPPALAPLNIGRLMRIRITDTGSHLFTGRIKQVALNPAPEQRTTILNLESLLAFYDRTTVTTSLQTNINPASLFSHLMTRVNSTTGMYSAEAISSADTISFAWYRDRELSGALQQIVGYGFYPLREHGDGTLQLYNRATGLFGGGSAVDTLTEAFGMSVVWDSDEVVNKLKVSGNPRKIDTNPATVAWLGQTISIPASSGIGFFLGYVDPVEITVPTPATSLTTPVSSSDWILNTASDNGGSFLMSTASLSITLFAETAVASIYNGSGNVGYLNKFQIRGFSLRAGPSVSGESQNNSSQAVYGMHQMEVSNNFLSGQDFSQQYANYIIGERADPKPRLSFDLKNDWPVMDKLVPGANLAMINSLSGVNSLWVARRIFHDVSLLNGIEHTMTVEAEYYNDRPWFTLDHPVRGQLSNGNQLAW